MTIDKNGLDIPDYLDKEFFKTALENGLKITNIEIASLNFTMGSAIGDNYSSSIYRVIVTYNAEKSQSQVLSLIVKSVLTGKYREVMESLEGYAREETMLFNVLPKMEALLENTKFAPKCYYTVDEPFKTIVLEDLRASGFTLADREKGLDEKQCKLVFEKLGKFHAASMKVAAEEPDLMDSFQHGFFTSFTINSPLIQSFFVESLRTQIPVVEKWKGYEKYAEKLKNIYKTMSERCLAAAKPSDDELKVLNHGDLWVTNFMVQYEKDDCENPLDVSFYDYQLCFYTSPGLDINYFLNTSVQFEVLKNRREFMIEEYYYKTFRSSLVDIGFEKIPTLADIRKEIRRKEFYGLVSAIGILPVICMDRKSSTDNTLEAFIDKETAAAKHRQACSSQRFEQVMKYVLERADKLGVLE